MAGRQPVPAEIAAGLLDEMAAARGDVTDLLGAYTRPLPIAVLCELLGIPVADLAWIAVTVAAYDERAEHQRVERELAALLHGADRRQARRARRRPGVVAGISHPPVSRFLAFTIRHPGAGRIRVGP